MIRNVKACVSCGRDEANIRRKSQCNAHDPPWCFCFVCTPEHCAKFHKEYLITPPDLVLLKHLIYGGVNIIIWCLVIVAWMLKNAASLLLFSGVAILVTLLTLKAYREHSEASSSSKIYS